uniref:Formylglycine-generating enzyme, required for sulfatase activity, contains SUMF1/FGE domain n=1 Tax=Candidatus Kentrum sp. FW TaxID=2126338 RepID=A0A450T3L6_9GAMM|nr:MAG: Formylglycine-generating enzyme, required for sulfatase activity, contains SUMF1/FGE domain [Candidatus Kentron sp. FW]
MIGTQRHNMPLSKPGTFPILRRLALFITLSSGLAWGTTDALADTRGLRVVTTKGEELLRYGKSFALLIGVGDYAHWSDLHQVSRELDRVQKMLKGQGFTVIRVNNPDSDELSDAFEDFKDKYGFDGNNRLLFFFSGHGHTRDHNNKGYLVPTDAPDPNDDETGFLRHALPMTRIMSWAREIEARHALFLFDSCFSGTVFKQKAQSKKPRHLTEDIGGKVRQFITAGDAGDEVPAKSTFTPAFVDAITQGKADLYRDGYITGTELGLYLKSEVPKFIRQTPQFGKIRDYELSRGDFVFVLGKPRDDSPGIDSTIERDFWNSIKQSRDPDEYRAYLAQYPRGSFAALAELRLRKFQSRASEEMGTAPGAFAHPTPSVLPKTGRLIVRSNVSGDTVFIDGKAVGATGPAAHILSPGEHEIRVEKEGFEPFETMITLSAGKEQTIRARLTRVRYANAPVMVAISGGCFRMGSPDSEKGRDGDERQHRVCVDDFSLARHEVTVAEFRRFVRATDYRTDAEKGKGCYVYDGSWEQKDWANWKKPGEGQSNGDRDPVRCVSWNDAQAYMDWLNRETGGEYRLPTEAEQEYAIRAGTTTRYFWGDNEDAACRYANVHDAASKRKYGFSWTAFSCNDGHADVAPVGSFRANGFDLYDMTGNVWEWSCSLYKSDYDDSEKRCTSKGGDGKRALRGGSWDDLPRRLRSANRFWYFPNEADGSIGFRLARDF